jgi:hypothetical protein
MIVFDLRCLEGGEVFEGWFSSTADFEDQTQRGLLECPFCRSARVEKAPMAPRVSRASGMSRDPKVDIHQLAKLQEKLLSGSEWVGEKFPEQARAMHLGEIDHRPVHGQASLEEARSLADEGVPVLPLPLPVVPPGQVN